MLGIKEILKGLLCGVLFVSAFFWLVVLTFLIRDGSLCFAVTLGVALLTNVLLGLLLAADSYLHVFYRWLISLPAGLVTFLVYRETDFVDSWLNRIQPGYGRLSAGGSFAAMAQLVLFCLCFAAAVAVAVFRTGRNRGRSGPAR